MPVENSTERFDSSYHAFNNPPLLIMITDLEEQCEIMISLKTRRDLEKLWKDSSME
jgi:hypothetical protein